MCWSCIALVAFRWAAMIGMQGSIWICAAASMCPHRETVCVKIAHVGNCSLRRCPSVYRGSGDSAPHNDECYKEYVSQNTRIYRQPNGNLLKSCFGPSNCLLSEHVRISSGRQRFSIQPDPLPNPFAFAARNFPKA